MTGRPAFVSPARSGWYRREGERARGIAVIFERSIGENPSSTHGKQNARGPISPPRRGSRFINEAKAQERGPDLGGCTARPRNAGLPDDPGSADNANHTTGVAPPSMLIAVPVVKPA